MGSIRDYETDSSDKDRAGFFVAHYNTDSENSLTLDRWKANLHNLLTLHFPCPSPIVLDLCTTVPVVEAGDQLKVVLSKGRGVTLFCMMEKSCACS